LQRLRSRYLVRSQDNSSSIIDQYPTTSIIFPDGAQLVMIGTLQMSLSFT